MTTQASMALMPIVSVINNHVTALSTDVAKYFGKNHFHVVRDIEKLIEKLPTCRASIFGASEVQIASNLKNAPAKLIKAYRMTRDGFTLLVMGWTGEKALQFKLAWLDAFNRMEEQLRKQQSFAEQDSTLISNEQQYELSSRVMRKTHALFGNKNYSFVYRALKRRFRIPRYTCLLQRDFETALAFIDGLKVSDFNVPDVKEEVLAKNYVVQFPSFTISASGSAPLPAVPAIPVSKHYITDNELQAIKSLIYYFDDLFKPQIQWASKEAYRQGRPDASRFYDVWHEPLWFIGRMRQLVSRNS
ncbi:Rha family transcriptional regulator [Parasutterella excrementihominis]|jgi:Rha family phage regulatory protein|uniref:Rha family transcriptional regulator n=1 Tax=Parasutterella excrementihominis TaxID=487175 RepID=UPI002430FC6B|nr:Rha family transcriptional regulator [Parasutterella excrementihominis]